MARDYIQIFKIIFDNPYKLIYTNYIFLSFCFILSYKFT